ncbi:Holliday junction ATP-dependent DNA helicase RuvA [Candidatus Kinetoplastibacterium sorsogonicusi]|uniref:Holliday junction branch migration complex subunit RuvA n=1 Tax=Candidatus Kinetoplastidibacterium kentomonadis TaxID=1576550 RepID=A0A3Q8EUJ1_9PROT|nr:Holliday junction branch migration protein RuvA [Candidatus Kinetoplastibacterium sorsogonicusi]AWD32630.1 Holliday junction ATP-dependent DNA helicase RuvA [Candidatus Kinetoplastibacterium sorsogonicusi]
MIDRIIGIFVEKSPNTIYVNVQGIVYSIEISNNILEILPKLNEQILIFVHLIIREDAHTLYGFKNANERNIFRMLIKVSGIGPRTALAILSKISIEELSKIIISRESYKLTTIPGIGKKTADRLILELKEKFNDIIINDISKQDYVNSKKDILDALIALGYSEKEVISVLSKLSDNIDVSNGIKEGLNLLSK